MKPNTKEVFSDDKIEKILKNTLHPTLEKITAILKKAARKKGLSLRDVGHLINASDEDSEKIFALARQIKRDIYGERLVLFAPLYISDYCINDCEYCGFHRRNDSPRKKLSLKEVADQTKNLIDMGHKRLLLEFGEHPQENPIDYVVDVIKTIYKTKSKNGEIRRVNVNIAATTVENYRKLRKAGIGTYQLFQETYHRPTFEKLHNGPKADFERQLFAHDRAQTAKIDDIGIGVLFGLYDWRFEILALLSHAQYLEKKWGVGPHTISFPRFQPANSVDWQPPHPVSEQELLKIIAILRLAVPYTGMIISTRESIETRNKAFEIGISQTSAASRVTVGGYEKQVKSQKACPDLVAGSKVKTKECGQFSTHDSRTVDEVVRDICKENLLPSFCTACYRRGRTGEKFMDLAKPGEIHNFCRPNAILTFQEYLLDYASPETKKLGRKIITQYLEKIPNKKRLAETQKRLLRLQNGERDLYF